MKWFTKGIVAALALALVASVSITPTKAYTSVSFGLFYDDLSPHGSWLVSGQYGRVWQPDIYAADWNPYYDGHWEYTDVGWTWVSDYEWGSIPYHYGTWVLDARYGWVWVPGYTWAPSWVVFRSGGDYCGWAPVPVGWSFGMSVNIDPSFFVFVSTRDFLSPSVRLAIVPRTRVREIVSRTTIINNITIQNNVVVNRGPDVRTVERVTGRRIQPKPIERVARVAPFDRVDRAALRVPADRSRGKLRAAEPVPSSQPLPESRRASARDQRMEQGSRRQQPERPRRETSTESQRSPNDQNARRSTQDRAAEQQQLETQNRRATDARTRERAQADARQRAQTEDRSRMSTEQRSRTEAQDRQKAQADANRRADDRATAEARQRAQAQAQDRSRTSTEQRSRTEAQDRQKAQSDTAARAQADARARERAQADARAKAQADAKAKAQAEAKKKKKPPEEKKDDRKDQSPGSGQ